jgi:hypothetical protein
MTWPNLPEVSRSLVSNETDAATGMALFAGCRAWRRSRHDEIEHK